MSCPACGESVTPDMEFCRTCLSALPRDRATAATVAPPVVPPPEQQRPSVEAVPELETCPRHAGMPYLDVCADCGERICAQCSREMETKARPRCDRCLLKRDKVEAVRQRKLWPTVITVLLLSIAFSVIRVLVNRPPGRAEQMRKEMERITEDAQRNVGDVSEELEAADRILKR